MRCLHELGHHSSGGLVDEVLHPLTGALIVHVQAQLLLWQWLIPFQQEALPTAHLVLDPKCRHWATTRRRQGPASEISVQSSAFRMSMRVVAGNYHDEMPLPGQHAQDLMWLDKILRAALAPVLETRHLPQRYSSAPASTDSIWQLPHACLVHARMRMARLDWCDISTCLHFE